MKILYLRTVYWFDLRVGGSVTHTAGVINALDKRVNLIVVSNEKLEGVKKDIIILKPIYIPFLPNYFGELLYNFKIIKFCKNIKVDFIYQRYSGFSFCGAYLSKIKKIPLILEFNSSDVWKIKHWDPIDGNIIKKFLKNLYNHIFKCPLVSYIERYNLINAKYIVVVSEALREFIIKLGIKNEKIIVIPNGVDEKEYRPDINCQDIKLKYNLYNKITIGFVGTFGKWHGVEKIPLAYGKLIKEYPYLKEKTKLLLIGNGFTMNKVIENIKLMKIEDNVILTGIVPKSDIPKYLSACDILINSTIPNPDGSEFFGSPTKLFEYMAMGKAIICSNIGQMSKILIHKKTAYMVRAGDIDDMAYAMKVLIEDEKLREYLGENARKEVIEKYTWDKHVERILNEIKNE
ncbi:MAG: glycosyltransferase family 4 protein [candidate division WOR-3 bacterium]